MKLQPRNWDTFQHYKHRRPPWIRLYRTILDDYEYHCLPVASRALAPYLWLLASEYDDGMIDSSKDAMAFRFRMSVDEFVNALTPLIHGGFFSCNEDASTMLASCNCDATAMLPQSRDRVETEDRKEKRIADFQLFWDAFGLKQGKGGAEKAWKAIKNYDQDLLEKIIQAAKREAERRPQLTANGRTPKWAQGWLNERRWEDEPLGNVVSISASPGAARSLEIAARLRQERLDREATSEV